MSWKFANWGSTSPVSFALSASAAIVSFSSGGRATRKTSMRFSSAIAVISAAYTSTAAASPWAAGASVMDRRSRSLRARVWRSLKTRMVCMPQSMSQPGNPGNRWG